MTDFVKAATVGDIPENGRLWVEFEEETVIIFRVGDDYYCIADLCTHDGGPLEDGELEGYSVECPRHGACFDIRSGKALSMPATSPVPTYQVRVENGEIYVENPDIW